ncbi:hypothetical protein EDD18DRAFT_1205653 [Armillaria luteobubalina]|uniref:Uncharacterized protein n=1 Tax=Armillaria luteobubalina TaxID=153913 RepID=A0AA39TCR1_9AGAR|nr:hypothetical protein EDD18DRAFT_1205653 [Armillaria luteobubalina]
MPGSRHWHPPRCYGRLQGMSIVVISPLSSAVLHLPCSFVHSHPSSDGLSVETALSTPARYPLTRLHARNGLSL